VRVLLTGGSGFLGRTIRESLGPELEIVAPRQAELDVTDAGAVDALFARERFDAVIHAAISGGAKVMETTLRGFLNVYRHADEVARVIHFGSGAEYDKARDLVKVSEEEIGRRMPADSYGIAKLACNELVRKSGNQVNLRLFGIFGPHENYLSRFISNTAAKALLGIPIVVRQDVVFDYLWVGDLADVVREMLRARSRPFTDANVTPTAPISLAEIVDLVGAAVGRGLDVSFEIAGRNCEYTGDNSRLRAALPGLRFTSYAEAVARMVEHFRARLDTLDRDAIVQDDYRRRCVPRAAEDPRPRP
jgi:UDP-glucose 4-epimerase